MMFEMALLFLVCLPIFNYIEGEEEKDV